MRIVGHIRQRWPDVEIIVRGDSGFARDDLMAWCEDNGVHYIFGLQRNTRLVKRIIKLLKIGAQVSLSVRRVWIRCATGCPHQKLFSQVLQNLRAHYTPLRI